MGMASYPGGGGPLLIPLLLLLGWFFSERRVARVLCLALFVAWFILIVVEALRERDPAALGFPVLTVALWMILDGIRKADKRWDG